MYANERFEFGDFQFLLDELLIARLINPKVFLELSGEHYAIIRATVRSEMLYSDEVASVIRPSIKRMLEQIKEIHDLPYKVVGGLSLHGRTVEAVGGMARSPRVAYGGPGRVLTQSGVRGPDADLDLPPQGIPDHGRRRLGMYGGGFMGFDDILIDRFLTPRQAASMRLEELVALGSLIKSELLFSEEVQAHLKRRINETVTELSREKQA
jgi:hypothetical protein